MSRTSQIKFRVFTNNTTSDLVKWKVRNDNSSSEIRGEITDNKTHAVPESTAYVGRHYAECYAIKNNECVAKDRVNVIVKQ